MRRSSSSSSQSSLQFIAIAAASDTAAMSFRSQYRGGGGGGGGRNQWHRGLCNHTTAGRGELVTGDSHCSSVRDANLDFRQGGRGGFHPPPHNPRPYFNQDQHFNNGPHFNHHQPFNPPHFNGNQPFNPRPPFQQNHSIRQPYPYRPRPPKPWYYREWEYAIPGTPQHCERFIVLSYNLLADYLALNHRGKLYYHIPRHMLDWEWRKRNILFELALWSADIMCFQEVDRFRELEEELKLRGYSGFWKMRTGDPVDGCAIFWRASRFKLLHEECIEFNKMGLRDNVAQICVLESVRQYNIKTLPTRSTGYNKVVVCNIHVLYNPRRGEIKLAQIRVLLDKAHAVSKIWNDAPVVICGDFNCTPKSPLYNFISTQKLDLSELARDKLSGQASCEIHSPKPFSINAGAPSADNPINPSTMINGTEVGAKQSDSRSDMQRQNFPVTSVGNVSFVNDLSERLCSSTVLDVSKKSCTDGHYVTECNEKSDRVRKESQQSSDNGYKNETETTTFVPFDQLNESYCNSNCEESSPVDEIIDKDNEFTPSVASDHKGIRADTMETEHKEVNPSAYSDSELSGEHSQSVLSQNSGSMNCDKGALPLVDGSPTTSGVYLEPVNALNSDVSSFTPFRGHSVPDPVELSSVSCLQNPSPLIPSDEKDNPSQQHHVNVLDASTSIDILQDGKRTNLSLNEPDVDIKVETNVGEDYNTFLSELHDSSAFPSDSGQSERSDLVDRDYTKQYASPSDEVLDDFSTSMNSEPFDVYKSTYDPSSWTPMEIETATGNADCTCLEHPLKLRSTYTEVEDLSQTRDSNREPQVTSYHRLFLGTVDYIWRTEGLQTVRVLAPIPKHAMQWTPGFPTKRWGSDHISLVSELAFVKDVNDDVQSG